MHRRNSWDHTSVLCVRLCIDVWARSRYAAILGDVWTAPSGARAKANLKLSSLAAGCRRATYAESARRWETDAATLAALADRSAQRRISMRSTRRLVKTALRYCDWQRCPVLASIQRIRPSRKLVPRLRHFLPKITVPFGLRYTPARKRALEFQQATDLRKATVSCADF